jgi:RNA polymerase sigma-B factor
MQSSETRSEAADRLWSAYQLQPTDELREQLIEHYRPLALMAVRQIRYSRDEDLGQVAMIGLVKAVDRFDPTRENGFYAFALPTILGEVKRYLRDHYHLIRCPRSLHDLRDQVRAREQEMVRQRGQIPTLAEVAQDLGVDLETILEAMEFEEICHPVSLDGVIAAARDDSPATLGECFGARDERLEQVETRIDWGQILDRLNPRLRTLIELRYFEQLTQREAGQRLGISQMHVSRLERRALDQLRTQAAGE